MTWECGPSQVHGMNKFSNVTLHSITVLNMFKRQSKSSTRRAGSVRTWGIQAVSTSDMPANDIKSRSTQMVMNNAMADEQERNFWLWCHFYKSCDLSAKYHSDLLLRVYHRRYPCRSLSELSDRTVLQPLGCWGCTFPSFCSCISDSE
jgi:hypothetical protein